MSDSSELNDPKSPLAIRDATLTDERAIWKLTARVPVGTDRDGYSEGAGAGQINNFPAGRFVITVGDISGGSHPARVASDRLENISYGFCGMAGFTSHPRAVPPLMKLTGGVSKAVTVLTPCKPIAERSAY